MTQADDNDLLAAEYVLGSLPIEERVDVDVRRATEHSLDLAIQQWEARLSPLLQSVEPVDPPAYLLQRIEGQLFAKMKADQPNAKQSESGELVLLRRVKRWQGIAAGAFGLAAAITLVFGLRETGVLKAPQTDAPTSFVAMLQKDAASPAFVVSVNIATREMTIRPVAAERANGKSYELWLVNKAFPAPRSLGVVDDQVAPRAPHLRVIRPTW